MKRCRTYARQPLDVVADAMIDRNATVVVLSLYVGEAVEVTGSSKREPGDHYDEQIGTDLALARALRNAADELGSRAARAVKTNAAC